MGFHGNNQTNYPEVSDKTGDGYFSVNSTILPETIVSVQSAAANIGEEQCDMSVNLKCQNFGKQDNIHRKSLNFIRIWLNCAPQKILPSQAATLG